MSNSFNKSMVDVQRRNPFDLSFINSFTAKVGTLTPCLCRKVMPGDVLSDGINFNVELPPLAAPFRGRIDVCFEAFFVPNRLIYGGWQNYMLYNGGLQDQFKPEGVPVASFPHLQFMSGDREVGSLADYLGFGGFHRPEAGAAVRQVITALPFLAYHKIWEDWYRDPLVQKPAFMPAASNSGVAAESNPQYIPFSYMTEDTDVIDDGAKLFDGVAVTSLRQRNYHKDYFTSAYTTVSGGVQPTRISIDSNDTFTIQQFRAANALTRFAERNQIARGDYKRSIFVNYGVSPSDAICNRSIFLGRSKGSITNNPVYNQTPVESSQVADAPRNPFVSSLGGRGSNAYASDSGQLFKNFKATEHGYVIVLFSLVPHTVYSGYTSRELLENGKFSDAFCVPAFAQVGNQAILESEIAYSLLGANPLSIFGYTERYAHYKTSFDEVHGLLKSGQSLSFMSVKRDIDDAAATISSAFIEIPTTALDDITAVKASLSNYGCIVDVFHQFNMLRPLPKYSIPTLCDEILDSKWLEVSKSNNL